MSAVSFFYGCFFFCENERLLYHWRLLSCPYHAVDTYDDEGDGEDLSHIDGQRSLEGFLDLLGVLDEEGEGGLETNIITSITTRESSNEAPECKISPRGY